LNLTGRRRTTVFSSSRLVVVQSTSVKLACTRFYSEITTLCFSGRKACFCSSKLVVVVDPDFFQCNTTYKRKRQCMQGFGLAGINFFFSKGCATVSVVLANTKLVVVVLAENHRCTTTSKRLDNGD
jgi:hypothetical protein